MLTYQLEPVDTWWADVDDLVHDHWHELGLDTDLKGDINIDVIRQLETAGRWLTMTVRDDGKLAGYAVGLFSPHLHYQSSGPMMMVDMYYVAPRYRSGTGAKLLKFMESVAKSKDAIKIYLSCKVHKDHSALFELLGYKLSDHVFIKRVS